MYINLLEAYMEYFEVAPVCYVCRFKGSFCGTFEEIFQELDSLNWDITRIDSKICYICPTCSILEV